MGSKSRFQSGGKPPHSISPVFCVKRTAMPMPAKVARRSIIPPPLRKAGLVHKNSQSNPTAKQNPIKIFVPVRVFRGLKTCPLPPAPCTLTMTNDKNSEIDLTAARTALAEDLYMRKFLSYLKNERQHSENTLKNYFQDAAHFIELNPELPFDSVTGAFRWEQVDERMARKFVIQLSSAGRQRSSVNRKLCSLRAFFRFLLREEILSNNPFHLVRSLKTGRKLPMVLSVEQVGTLLDAPAKYCDRQTENRSLEATANAAFASGRDAAILEVIYSGGLRISEATNLNFEDLDFLSGLFKVRGKGNRERLCMLGKPALAALKKYLEEREKLGLGTRREKGALFRNQNGGRLTPRYVERAFKNYVIEAGL